MTISKEELCQIKEKAIEILSEVANNKLSNDNAQNDIINKSGYHIENLEKKIDQVHITVEHDKSKEREILKKLEDAFEVEDLKSVEELLSKLK